MSPVLLCVDNDDFFAALRHQLRDKVSGRLGHVDEAIARGFGFGSRAGALAALNAADFLKLRADDLAFLARLRELGGDASEGAFEAAIRIMLEESEDAHELTEEEFNDPTYFPFTPPWELDEDEPLRMAWEHDTSSRGNR